MVYMNSIINCGSISLISALIFNIYNFIFSDNHNNNSQLARYNPLFHLNFYSHSAYRLCAGGPKRK